MTVSASEANVLLPNLVMQIALHLCFSGSQQVKEPVQGIISSSAAKRALKLFCDAPEAFSKLSNAGLNLLM